MESSVAVTLLFKWPLFFTYFLTLSMFSINNVNGEASAKSSIFTAIKVVQEPASYNYQVNNIPATNFESKLIPNTEPSNFSGPYFLETLTGRCFNKSNERYRFEFCPFQNVTQHETGHLWNAYKGIVGIWQDWKIENNTFIAMMYANGDFCGNIAREAAVYFQCGEINQVVNVTEPSQCHYRIDFATPLVCSPDALLVYPNLPLELQQKWDLLESELHADLITEVGYKKWLSDLFVEAGLRVTPKTEKKSSSLTKNVTSTARTLIDAEDETIVFNSIEQCVLANEGLKTEIQRLKEQLSALKILQNI